MTNIFDTLDKKKLSTKLYPDETIVFLSDLLNVIGETFDPYKKFNDQFLGKTKKQYEDMLYYILEKFSKIDQLRDEEGSVKFILSKVLESIIFKNLETIYFYNLYNDPTKREIRTQLERGLDHIYQCNLLSEQYILPEEVNKLVVDGIVLTSEKEINKALQTTMKKTRYIYNIKNNELFNGIHKNGLRQVFENLEGVNLGKPLKHVFTLGETKFTTSQDMKTVYNTDKEKLACLLFEDNSFYLTRNGYLRSNTKLKKLVVKSNFNNLTYLNGKLCDENLNIQLQVESTIWDYYQLLIQNSFIRVIEGEQIVEKQYPLSTNLSIYESLVTIPESKIVGESKFGKINSKIYLKSIEVNGRQYKTQNEIYYKLQGLGPQDIFIATYSDDTQLVVSKDLNYFYLLNLNLVTKIFIDEKELSLEQLDQLLVYPALKNCRSLQTFINTFLDYELEDYLNEYEDMKLLDIISKNFSKNDIIKYTREYKTKIDRFEETLNISKLLPKSLHE